MVVIAELRARCRLASRFLADTNGTTAMEYALIASLISVVIIGSVNVIGAELLTQFYNKLPGLFP